MEGLVRHSGLFSERAVVDIEIFDNKQEMGAAAAAQAAAGLRRSLSDRGGRTLLWPPE